MESGQISPAARKRLQAQYESLNVAALHRRIEELRDRLFAATEAKNTSEPAKRRGRDIRVVQGRRQAGSP